MQIIDLPICYIFTNLYAILAIFDAASDVQNINTTNILWYDTEPY